MMKPSIHNFAIAAAVLILLAGCMPGPGPGVQRPQGSGTESVTLPLVIHGNENASSATQSVSLPLVVSGSDTVPNPAVPAGSLVSSAQVAEISQAAGWQVNVPAWLPEGYQFGTATYDPTNQIVLLTFLATRQLPGNDASMTETKIITLVQALRNDVIPLLISPSTNVQAITVNGRPAAYATGAWQGDAVTGQATWTNASQLQNVYWQIAPLYLNLNTDDPQVSQADLLRMAESVK